MLISRRGLLRAAAGFLAGGLGLAGYGIGWEPMREARVVSYRPGLPGWPAALRLRVAVVSDIHACEPFMPAERIARVVEGVAALEADLIVLLGDFVAGHRFVSGRLTPAEWARPLAALKAPLGVYSVLGNHDWWDDPEAQRRGAGPIAARLALEDAGISVLENVAVRLESPRGPFWLAGLADQLAIRNREERGWRRYRGLDDLNATLAGIGDAAPVILLAHEPDIFPRVPDRVTLTLAGHTHGGQVRVLGYAPVIPSRYGDRYGYGHIVEDGRHLIVSAGVGCSILPVRIGMPPEVGLVELGGTT